MFTGLRRWMPLCALLLALLYASGMGSSPSPIEAERDLAPGPGTSILTLPESSDPPSSLSGVPRKVYDLLQRLEERDGSPLPGYVGGREFQNRERRLPRGRYREYDVNPKRRGQSRDAERIVIEQRTGKAYYNGDHYRTFTPIN